MRTTRLAGAERLVVEIAKALQKHYRVEIAALDKKGDPLPIQVRQRGIFAILFGKYELIHSHLFLPGLLVRVRRIFDTRFVWIHTVHYCSYQGQKWGRVKKILDHRFIFPKADNLVAVSRQTFESIRCHPRAELIENAIELTEKAASVSLRNSSSVTIGAVSMLRSEKGLEDLVSAMALVTAKFPNVKLRIAGEGPELQRLLSLTKRLRLTHCVEFLGFVDDIDSFFKTIDICVNPARTESFGMAMLEAMQFSLPLVATAVGANSDLLLNGALGILVPRNQRTSHGLAEAIETVMADIPAWRQRSYDGLKYYQKHLKTEGMLGKYVTLVRKALRPGICMICPVVTQATGGIQRQLLLQSRELSLLGYRVFLLQRKDKINERLPQWAHVEFLSTPNPWSSLGKETGLGHRIRGVIFLGFGLFQIFRHRHRISVLHAHQLFSPTLMGVFAKRLFKKRLVVKVTASGPFGELRELKRLPFFKWRLDAFRYIDRLIVLSEQMRREMLELGFAKQQIELMPNGVELPALYRAQSMGRGSAPSHKFQILYCGRLSTEKCLEDLLNAAAALGTSGFPAEVHLVGGTYGGRDVTPMLRTLAERLSKDTQVIFHGNQANVEPFYLAADVFVLPSVSEGMSNALLEALAYGLPCVVSDIEPNRSLVESGVNGLCFQQGNVEDLKRQLETLARDKADGSAMARSLGSHARKDIQSMYSASVIGEKLGSIYYSLLSGPSLPEVRA